MYYILCTITTTNKRRGCELGKEQRLVYGSVWREEGDGKNGVIIL